MQKLRNNKSLHISVSIVLVILGIIIALQFKTQQEIFNSLDMQDPEDLAAMLKSMEVKREQLDEALAQLEQQQADIARQAAAGKSLVQSVIDDLERLKLVSGLVPVKGPGISITITEDNPILYLDLVDLVNELWASGAEAIAINDHRIIATTPITSEHSESTSYLAVNGERLLFPIIIKAIGDPHTLEKGLTFSGGLLENLQTLYSIYPQLQQKEELILPAVKKTPSFSFAYAQ